MKKPRSSVLRVLAFALFLLSTGWSQARSAGESPEVTGAFYALSVSDLDAAIGWYSEFLGFRLTSRTENEQRRGALLERPGAVLELAEFQTAVARDELKSGAESHEIHGIFKIGFTTEEIDAAFASLEALGAELFFPIVDTSDGQRTFGIKDIEGNIVQFIGK